MEKNIAYLSKGGLYYKKGDNKAKEIKSIFIEELRNKMVKNFQSQNWKAADKNSQFGMHLWGNEYFGEAHVNAFITGVAKGETENEIVYAVETDSVGALLKYDVEKNEEKRIIHSNNFYIVDLNRNDETKEILCSSRLPDGSASIGVIRNSSTYHITEGQSIDEAPCWIPGANKEILFQSAGIAFNHHGYRVGTGNCSIERLNMNNNEMETVLGNRKFDFLLPKMSKKGEMFFIRRPFEVPGSFKGTNVLTILLDIILFPFRLARAIFHFLNKMSLIFSNKPLTTAGGGGIEVDPNKNFMYLRGKLIDVKKILKQNRKENSLSIVPSNWELCKKDTEGRYSILAKSVASYDIDDEGNIIYTNGSAIYKIDENGDHKVIEKGNLIENVYFV